MSRVAYGSTVLLRMATDVFGTSVSLGRPARCRTTIAASDGEMLREKECPLIEYQLPSRDDDKS